MKVKVEVSSYFRRFTDSMEFEVEVSENMYAEDIIGLIGIPIDQVGFVTVNNQKMNMDVKLKDGEKLGIYPYIIGG